MALSTSQLASITKQIEAVINLKFREFQSSENNWVAGLSKQVTAQKVNVTLPFVEDSGQLRKVGIGEPPIFENLRGQQLKVTLEAWQNGIELPILDATDSDIPDILQDAAGLAAEYATWQQQRASEILQTGDTAFPGYDGLSLFNDAHVKGSTTFDNKLVGTFDATNFQAGRTAMMRIPTDYDANIPLGILPTHIIHPPELFQAVTQLINNNLLPEANFNTENPFKGQVKQIDTAFLTDPNDWYLVSNYRQSPLLQFRHHEMGTPRVVAELQDKDQGPRDQWKYRWWTRVIWLLYPSRPELFIKFINP